MITFLRGRVFAAGPGYVELDVHGVGYRVWVPERVERAARAAEDMFLYTYHHMREDGQELYGFLTAEDRAWFEQLLKVSGIGPKGALQIVSAATRPDFFAALAREDTKYLASLPGVGKKTAQRLVVELREVASGFSNTGDGSTTLEQGSAGGASHAGDGRPAPANQAEADVVEALKTLGYNERQALEAARAVFARHRGISLEEALKLCLQSLDRARWRG